MSASAHCWTSRHDATFRPRYADGMDFSLPLEDRRQAAELLAECLAEYRGRNPLILAIPRGAVPMGRVLADRLEGELDVVLVRKIPSAIDPELAVGAVDEHELLRFGRARRKNPGFLENRRFIGILGPFCIMLLQEVDKPSALLLVGLVLQG